MSGLSRFSRLPANYAVNPEESLASTAIHSTMIHALPLIIHFLECNNVDLKMTWPPCSPCTGSTLPSLQPISARNPLKVIWIPPVYCNLSTKKIPSHLLIAWQRNWPGIRSGHCDRLSVWLFFTLPKSVLNFPRGSA